MLTDEQSQLRTQVRALADTHAGEPALRAAIANPDGCDRALWQRVAAMGLVGLAVPEEFGGSGGGPAELALAFGELGRRLSPVPLLATAGLAIPALLRTAAPAQRARLLPPLAAGHRIAALAAQWDTGDSSTAACPAVRAEPSDQGTWRLHGTASLVPDAPAADLILVLSSTPPGASLFAVEARAAGVHVEPQRALDLTRRLGTVTLDAAPAELIGTAGQALPAVAEAVEVGRVMLAAELMGAADYLLAVTLDFARQRVQFGAPIGTFQVVKHRCADMYVEIELARSVLAHAITVLQAGSPLAAAASMAKLACGEALSYVAAQAVQLHGGIAITWEHFAHLYLRRARSSEYLLGTARGHRRRLAAAVPALAGSTTTHTTTTNTE